MLDTCPEKTFFWPARWRSNPFVSGHVSDFSRIGCADEETELRFEDRKRKDLLLAGQKEKQQMTTNLHAIKLAALPRIGKLFHIVADFQIVDDSTLIILALCGKVIEPSILVDVPHNQITCGRCRSVSAQYNHNVGYLRSAFDNSNDVTDELPF